MAEAAVIQTRPAPETTVGAIVAADFRTAEVFTRHGIDFCCGGHSSLAAVCREKGLDPATLQREIAAARAQSVAGFHDYASWPLPLLADYIIHTHHAYLNANTAPIAAYTDKIAAVHGARHPEVKEIAQLFAGIAADMADHLREEEEVLFPAVRRLAAAGQAGDPLPPADVETIRDSLAKLDAEHQAIGDAVHAIRRLSGGYVVPEDACNTFAVTYHKLEEFENDLHKHVHLENNILFPKAAAF